MEDTRLGTILLEGGIVDEAGLERCLAIQSLTGHVRPLGEILVEQGLLDAATVERLLQLQRERSTLQRSTTPTTDLGSSALFTAALANRAEEMVVSEGRPVRIRAGATWTQLTEEVLRGPEVWDFVRETMGSQVLEILAERHFVVQPWHLPGLGRGLATAFRQFDGVAVRVTFAAETALEPHAIGVPDAVTNAVRASKGLVLLVGERGIGRSDTLAALTRVAATDPGHYVVVVDDEPWPLPTGGALVVRRRHGATAEQRADALRSVVRDDPDAIVCGDVGCAATFEVALRAAEGGRLVVAWIDAPSVARALTRILDFYPVHDLVRARSSLAAVLRAVLVRHQLPDADHAGTVVASELLLVDDAARDLLRSGELSDLVLLLRGDGGRSGHSLDRSMLELLRAGKVRLEDVFVRVEEKAWLLERTRNMAGAAAPAKE
ncbi:MAG: Flp pilus assembly complex ATPase component TadA [Planctomycetes bacterium]|nr:Flp pilus assembly complex ATPase component TadA [Planctomycetota bacterium]